ncbi:MAG: hypothetical protein AVDCRST_MAG41-45 [uncultured Corynebacteriales bacterium]|uniref:Tyr recombinase domain-containing protein n=1 Tax=uncultured Mycobacteriales bacterium TaxID=581187 RepID=A0A6J4H1K0_9ACTN|nr:MAG: hypothetical protein AVDCRST_MAG41-45 [uncultured Corynebacteriales bacterium]
MAAALPARRSSAASAGSPATAAQVETDRQRRDRGTERLDHVPHPHVPAVDREVHTGDHQHGRQDQQPTPHHRRGLPPTTHRPLLRSRHTDDIPPAATAAILRFGTQTDTQPINGPATELTTERVAAPGRAAGVIDHRKDAREFKKLCERAGIPPYRVHDLRHAAATLLIAQGSARPGRHGGARALADRRKHERPWARHEPADAGRAAGKG